jgi:predicted extracellular nuclease
MKLVPCAIVATSLVLGVGGCRDDGGSEKPQPDAAMPVDQDNKIQDVQSDRVAEATKIKLKGVVVTAIDAFGKSTGNFWVQEPEGGPFSGVLVFGAKTADVAKLSVGDIVDLDGMEKDEFLPSGDATNRTITELRAVRGGAITISKVGSGASLTPSVIDAAALATMTAAQAEAELEKWEGVLVTVRNVTQANDQRSASTTDTTFFDFTIDGGIVVDTTLMKFPDTAVAGACYTSITGMGDYFYNYKVIPRSNADLVVGTGCPELRTSTITQVQLGTYTKAGAQPNQVLVRDVYVTALATASADNKSIWISTSPTAAIDEGVQVFYGKPAFPAGTVIGAKVDVLGTVLEYDNTGSTGDKLTEITRPTIKVKAPPDDLTPLVPISGVSADVLGDIGAAGEPYEGVLVQLSGLKVTAIGTNDATLSDTSTPAKTLSIDNDIFDYTPAPFAMDACYATVTGIASLNTLDDKRIILPRSAADLVLDPTNAACTPPTVR